MTFSKQWPAGLTNGLSAIDATKLVQLDVDHANAIDGLGGGTYAPATLPIRIGGLGIWPTLQSTKWPDFGADAGALRTFTRVNLLAQDVAMLGTAWTLTVQGSTGNLVPYVTGGASVTGAFIDLGWLPDNATVLSLTVKFTVPTGHGALPSTQPTFGIMKQAYAADASPTQVQSITGAAATVAAYENGGAEQSLTTTGGSFTIDRTNFHYYLNLIDEHGSNSIAGNRYRAYAVTFTTIDMRQP